MIIKINDELIDYEYHNTTELLIDLKDLMAEATQFRIFSDHGKTIEGFIDYEMGFPTFEFKNGIHRIDLAELHELLFDPVSHRFKKRNRTIRK